MRHSSSILKTLLLVIVVLINGCSWQLSPDHHYHVYIAPGFSDVQRGQIIDAVFDWQRVTNDFITFDLIGYVEGEAVIAIYPATSPELDGNLGNTKSAGDSYTIQLVSSNHFQQSTLHELGHALGLDHAASGIMCSDVGCASPQIECIDVQQLCRVWHNQCDATTMSPCVN